MPCAPSIISRLFRGQYVGRFGYDVAFAFDTHGKNRLHDIKQHIAFVFSGEFSAHDDQVEIVSDHIHRQDLNGLKGFNLKRAVALHEITDFYPWFTEIQRIPEIGDQLRSS